MNGGIGQRFCLVYFFNAILSATETPVMVLNAYGTESLNRLMYLGGIFDFVTEGTW